MNRQKMLEKYRQLEAAVEMGEGLTSQELNDFEYYKAALYPLRPSEMTDDELAQFYTGEFDEPSDKYSMRMSGKGTKRVTAVLSGRAIY